MSQAAGGPLKVVGVDFLQKHNTYLHHTNDYKNSCLIVRRGQEFQLKVTCSRELNDQDKIILQLSIGEKPMQTNGTLLSLNARSGQEVNNWRATISQTNGKECLMVVTSPADAIVGKYLLNVKTGPDTYQPKEGFIYVLFNPWCKADSVFMPDDDKRAEYVLSDIGYIYIGSDKRISGRPWNFGQFEEDILDCCMYLLDKSELKQKARKDPIIISRRMSALVNARDDAGVLYENWSGCYTGGTSPLAWTGSVPILKQYYKTKKMVSFGQCWVFSGVLTTVMRSLGIVARSVTNFNSAHDTEENLRVDIYFNEKGERMDDLTSDSTWNFHVWNEVWMKRPDLPKGYDGWQAIDATPQVKSQGIFQCGPCPVNAIKKGEVYLPYDSKFMFAEVNADKVFWMVKTVDGENKYIKLEEDTKDIGKNISTKAVGKNTREDITIQYKFPEGSPEERKAVETACSYLNSTSLGSEIKPPPEPLKANIQLGMDGEASLLPGNPIDLNIVVKNESAGAWTVDLVASCQMESYNGKVEASLATIKQTVQTEGKLVIQIPLRVAPETYMTVLMAVEDELVVKVNIIAEIQETNETFTKELTLTFQYPPLRVEMPETAKINEYFECAFIFENILSIPLENCKLHVEGLDIFKMETFDQGNVAPGGIFRSKIVCAPQKTGSKKIVAKLNSTQVKGITVEKLIMITE